MALTSREAVDTKATRLTRTSKVTWIDPTTALVDGDNDRYLIRKRADGVWTCTCPWGVHRAHVKPCSHVLAAALMASTSSQPAVAIA